MAHKPCGGAGDPGLFTFYCGGSADTLELLAVFAFEPDRLRILQTRSYLLKGAHRARHLPSRSRAAPRPPAEGLTCGPRPWQSAAS